MDTTTTPAALTPDHITTEAAELDVPTAMGHVDWLNVAQTPVPVDSPLAAAAGVPADAAAASLWTVSFHGKDDDFYGSEDMTGWGILYYPADADREVDFPTTGDSFMPYPHLLAATDAHARVVPTDPDLFAAWHAAAVRSLLAVTDADNYAATVATIAASSASVTTVTY